MAGNAALLHFNQQGIAVAVGDERKKMLAIAAGFSLAPQLAPAAGPKAGAPLRQAAHAVASWCASRGSQGDWAFPDTLAHVLPVGRIC